MRRSTSIRARRPRSTIVLRDYADKLPEALIEQFGRDVVNECERQTEQPFFVDYVRLDMWARRPE